MRRILIGIVCCMVSVFLLHQAAHARVISVCPDGTCNAKTISAAHTAADDGDTIRVYPGNYRGITVTKAVRLIGINDPAITLSGPIRVADMKTGFYIPAGSAAGIVIGGFTFPTTIDFPIYAVNVEGMVIHNNTMTSPVQGITLWDSTFCNVSNNTVNGPLRSTGTGGGLGILVGDNNGIDQSSRNMVIGNSVSGAVTGGSSTSEYWTAGICLFSANPGEANYQNVLYGNTLAMNKTTDGVQVAHIALDQELPSKLICIVKDNEVLKNTTSGTSNYKIVQRPGGLAAACNDVVVGNILSAAAAALEAAPASSASAGGRLVNPY
ncbi:MAG: hypothetical protein WAW37_14430 [Syntrophobacteraceae bacterium]